MAPLSVNDVFRRVNQSDDASISPANVRSFAEKAGVGDGWFGNIKVQKVVDEFMLSFDSDRNGGVDAVEFRRNIGKFSDMAGLDMKLFDDADKSPRNGRVTYGELQPELQRRFEQGNVPQASTRAEIGAKLAISAVGVRSAIAREDLESLLEDIRNPSLLDRLRMIWDDLLS